MTVKRWSAAAAAMVLGVSLAGCAPAKTTAQRACEVAATSLEPAWDSIDLAQTAGSASGIRLHLDTAVDELEKAEAEVAAVGDEELTRMVKKVAGEFDWVYNTAQGVLDGGDSDAMDLALARLTQAYKPIPTYCGWE